MGLADIPIQEFQTHDNLMEVTYTAPHGLLQPGLDPVDSPGDLNAMEQSLKSFNKKVEVCKHLNYWERLAKLGLQSAQRRSERYKTVYMWKVLNGLVHNFGINCALWNPKI